MRALYQRVAGIDVHRMPHLVTVLLEQPDGSMQRQTRQFGGFRRDCRELAAWLIELRIELVVMERTGIYWKSVHAHLENAGLSAWVVTLVAEQPIEQMLDLARGKPEKKREELGANLDGDLGARHLVVVEHIDIHLETPERELAEIDDYLLGAMQPYAWAQQLLQTIPGIDEIAAAMILSEIGDDMARFGRAQSLACWAALSPGNHECAGKRKSGRTAHGNSVIRCTLCECANAARNTNCTLAAKYRSLKVRKSHKKAIIAVAHKMICSIHILLSRREPYIDQGIDQGIDYAALSAKKNAPRWIRQLETIGRWPSPKTAATA